MFSDVDGDCIITIFYRGVIEGNVSEKSTKVSLLIKTAR